MTLEIPEILKEEHKELHDKHAAALRHPGEIGTAAQVVADRLHPHFEKEEAFALPPLGLLDQLSRGDTTLYMAEVLDLTDRLEVELPDMLREHEEIAGALAQLADVARRNGEAGIAETAEPILVHAHTEEALAYPAALLVGRYVALGIGR